MRINGMIVEFRTLKPIFDLESSGLKPNTERLLTIEEENDLYLWLGIKTGEPVIVIPKESERRIRITDEPTMDMGEYFEHPLTSVVKVGNLLGRSLWVFSWNPREE